MPHSRHGSQALDGDAANGIRVVRHPVTGQHGLVALRPFPAGAVITPFGAASTHRVPNYLSVQIGEHSHIELLPQMLQYLNHSCDPNIFLDTARMEVVALRDVGAGEELQFFYPASEWHMAQPFECLCGTAVCLKRIAGADTLPPSALQRYRLTDFIRSKLGQRAGL